jgi:SAM-dependent methyltransferase
VSDAEPTSEIRLATGRWTVKRPIAEGLRRVGLLGVAYRSYESLLAVDWGQLARGGRAQTGPDGLAVPPKKLRVVAGPAAADLDFFLRTGAENAALIRDALAGDGARIEDARAVLDFGCGCGRVIRHWHGLEDAEVQGCDIDERQIAWCRANLPFARFFLNRLEPPLEPADAAFDVAYSFSVFTHLPEELQQAWMAELARVIRPGGHLLFSTQGEAYLDRLTKAERERFAAGEQIVLYEEGAGTGLCSVYTPRSYVERVLGRGFDYVRFLPAAVSGQDAHLLRRAAA